jgi:hypothetical protein
LNNKDFQEDDMSGPISLREAERKIFKTAVDDGLWDVAIGCFLLQFALGPLLSPRLGDFWGSVVFLPFWAAVVVGIWLARKYLLRPRVGVVNLGPWRKTRLFKFNLWALLLLLAAFSMGVIAMLAFPLLPGWVILAMFGLVFITVFSVAAYYLDIKRWYLYGVLVGFSPLAGEGLFLTLKVPNHGLPITFGISAGIIILTGLVIFIRLLQSYPVPMGENTNGSEFE